jgi:iron complex outermembrane receptor protein
MRSYSSRGLAPRRLLEACAWALTMSMPGEAQSEIGASALRVDVTGSRIRRIDGEPALAVQVITAEEIRRAGFTTAAELMASVPANLNGFNDQFSILNQDTAGLNSANLRGLGDGNTLVLLNGRRLANYAYLSGTVDLSAIPLAALDRVEILMDGASSIYGTDAIAGVVNFITRRDYRGADLAANVAIPQHGGAEHYQVTMNAGVGDLPVDRYNAFVTVDWQKDRQLRAADRGYSRTGYRPDEGVFGLSRSAFPANIFMPPVLLANPGFEAGCAPPGSIPFGGSSCMEDPQVYADTLPATESLSVVARGTLQYASSHALFVEYVYVKRRLDSEAAPTPVPRFVGPEGAVARYPSGGPYYPTAFAAGLGLTGDLDILYRLVTLGNRANETRTGSQRIVAGGAGRLGAWDYDIAYNHSRNTAASSLVGGHVYGTKFLSALATGVVNPWGAFGTDGQALLEDALVEGEVRSAKGTMDQIDARVTGELARLPLGRCSLHSAWRRAANGSSTLRQKSSRAATCWAP